MGHNLDSHLYIYREIGISRDYRHSILKSEEPLLAGLT